MLIKITKNVTPLTTVAGSLQIRHSLESDEGKYECVAENSIGVAYSYGANLYVRGTRHFQIPIPLSFTHNFSFVHVPPPSRKKNREKYFLANYYVKFGRFRAKTV